MKISEVLEKYDTDKHTNEKGGHCYGLAYDYLFRPYEGEIDLLEVGTYHGESLLAWREFFPEANITGIDIEDTVEEKHPDINYLLFDIANFRPSEKFDIVIDDGSHHLSDVVHTVNNIKLKPGGMMVIEDCQAPDHWYKKIKKYTNYTMEGIDLREVNDQHDDYLIVLRSYGVN